MRKAGFVLLVVLLCSFASFAGAKPTADSFDSYESAVREYFDALSPDLKGVDYSIRFDPKENPWLEEKVHGAALVQAYAKSRMPEDVGTFIFWKGTAYVMPGEFNRFTADANIKIKSEEDALGLAELYVNAWEPTGIQGAPPVITLQSISDIPQEANPIDQENMHPVTKPHVKKKDTLYLITLYTWSDMGGFLREWHVTVDYKGEVTGNNVLLEEFIGDCEVEGALSERGPAAPAPLAGGATGEQTRNVVIGGATRFVIHWRPEDFIAGVSDSDVNTVVGWVETAATITWQRIITDAGFAIPTDPVIDIYIWNDTVSWGQAPASPGKGAYCAPPNSAGEMYIYVMEHQVGWWTPSAVYYANTQDAYTATVCHEYLHAVSWGYKAWNIDDWIGEGTNRYIPTYVINVGDGEFWQNSFLAGLAGGPYFQDASHRSKYIRESLGYLAAPTTTMRLHGYDACIYWRYITEHYGGIATLVAVYDKVKAQDPGYDFGKQIAAVNSALGTTDIHFSQFAKANYLELSPFAFARDDEFYQFSDRYYRDVARETIALTTGSSFPVIKPGSVGPYATKYYDIDPGNIRRLKLSFNGDNADTFSVIAFKGHGSTADEVAVPLDGNKDGSVTISGADSLDIVGLMIAHVDTGGTGSYTLQLEKLNSPPVADAKGPYSAPEGTPILLDASGTTDADGDTLEYRWDVNGDGTFEIPWTADAQVSYTACDNFAWTATLEVRDWDATSSDTAAITTTNENPDVEAGPDQAVEEGDVVSFSATASDAGSCDTLSYSWDFGDGTPAVEGTLTPTHTYCNNDEYTVTLTVRDDDGGSTTDSLTVSVENVPPVANAGPDQTAPEGTAVSFSGTISDAGSCDVLTYSWDFGDGSPKVSDTLTPTHAYGDNGVYTVTLTVSDGEDEGTDSLTVTVTNVEPTVTKGAMDQPNPQFILPRVHTLTFHGTFRDPGWLDTHTALWSFGDGTTDPGILSEENSPPDATGTVTATHAYDAPGDYLVTVTVTDDDGGAGTSATWSIHVADVVEAKHDLAAYIQALQPNAFKGNAEQRKAALANKIAALDDMLTREEWNGFITSIVSDVRSKADGQVDGKANDDWIKEDDAQSHICMKIDDIVAYVKTFM